MYTVDRRDGRVKGVTGIGWVRAAKRTPPRGPVQPACTVKRRGFPSWAAPDWSGCPSGRTSS
ncbi:hypothetical protein GCM10023223_02660 [Stackebrandtia albiflava]